MIYSYLKNLLKKNKEFILKEFIEVKGLMQLLMKERNTSDKWTKEENKELISHIKEISKVIPLLVIFILPGGSFLIPFLAEAIDRRSDKRTGTATNNNLQSK